MKPTSRAGNTVRRAGLFAALALSPLAGSPEVAGAQEEEGALPPEIETGLWLDGGEEAVLVRGQRVRVYYTAARDAYVAIFRLDTDGNVHLLHPRGPDQYHVVQREREYRLLFPDTPYWLVDDSPGLGYFFIVASMEPFDFSQVPHHSRSGGWDLSYVGRHFYADPYEAIDAYVAALVPDWEYVPWGVSLTPYHVEDQFDFPRFMCYDCHGFQSYDRWDPYRSICAEFRVVVWDDPYDYPARRFGGRRVVYPRAAGPRFEFKEVAEVGGRGPPIRRTRPAGPPTLGDGGAGPRLGIPQRGAGSRDGLHDPSGRRGQIAPITGRVSRPPGLSRPGAPRLRPSDGVRTRPSGAPRAGSSPAVRPRSPGQVRTRPPTRVRPGGNPRTAVPRTRRRPSG